MEKVEFLPLPLETRVAQNQDLPVVPTQHKPLISIDTFLRETETRVRPPNMNNGTLYFL